MSEQDECPGKGLCHGCLNWCAECGEVGDVCDARLRGDRCDQHPVPPPWRMLRSDRQAAEKLVADGKRLQREGAKALEEVVEGERRRRAYDAQLREQERAEFAIPDGSS